MKAVLAVVGAMACLQASAFIVPSGHSVRSSALQVSKTGTPFPVVDPSDVAKEDKSVSALSITEQAAKKWAALQPWAASRGYGLTTKAERWNGRHAMAGWIILLLTGWGAEHDAIPQGALDPKVWGQWVITNYDAATGAYSTISEERASILAFHLHLAAISVFAANNRFEGNWDNLTLEDGEEDEPAAGVFVPFRVGLTKEAELLNGRLAMFGLTSLLIFVGATGQEPLTIINDALGGLLFK